MQQTPPPPRRPLIWNDVTRRSPRFALGLSRPIHCECEVASHSLSLSLSLSLFVSWIIGDQNHTVLCHKMNGTVGASCRYQSYRHSCLPVYALRRKRYLFKTKVRESALGVTSTIRHPLCTRTEHDGLNCNLEVRCGKRKLVALSHEGRL